MNKEIINKTMDRDDLELPQAKTIISELENLLNQLSKNNAKVSSWYGTFSWQQKTLSDQTVNRGFDYQPLDEAARDDFFPWFLYWEICWLVLNNDFKPGQKVLDMGGSSSLFSYYLAAKGLDVTTVDLQHNLIDNANEVAKKMGWKLKNHCMDMKTMEFDHQFDHIVSVCVYEHINEQDRIAINKRINAFLKKGGHFSITFDYQNPSASMAIDSPESIERQFIAPLGLSVRGNKRFFDNGKRYLLHPFFSRHYPLKQKLERIKYGEFPLYKILTNKKANDYTFAALFLAK